MFIIGAGTLRYRDIVDVIDAAKGAGVEKVGIVTEGMRKAGGATTRKQLESQKSEVESLKSTRTAAPRTGAAVFFCDGV